MELCIIELALSLSHTGITATEKTQQTLCWEGSVGVVKSKDNI